MFENKSEPIISSMAFVLRMGRSFGLTLIIIAVSLLFGTMGYQHFGNLSWVDGLLNAAMILTGMGPVNTMPTTSGKLFSTFYALYSGIAFLTIMAVVMAPVIHRLLQTFHVDDDDDSSKSKSE